MLLEREPHAQVTNRRAFLKQGLIAAGSVLAAGATVAAAAAPPSMPDWQDEFKPYGAAAYELGRQYRAELPIRGKVTVEHLGTIMHQLTDLEVQFHTVRRPYYVRTKDGGVAFFPSEWGAPERELDMLAFVITSHIYRYAPGLCPDLTANGSVDIEKQMHEATMKGKILERCFLAGLNGE